jgi:hypothetical protein
MATLALEYEMETVLLVLLIGFVVGLATRDLWPRLIQREQKALPAPRRRTRR